MKEEGALKWKGMKTEVATVYSPSAEHIGHKLKQTELKQLCFDPGSSCSSNGSDCLHSSQTSGFCAICSIGKRNGMFGLSRQYAYRHLLENMGNAVGGYYSCFIEFHDYGFCCQFERLLRLEVECSYSMGTKKYTVKLIKLIRC